MVLLELPDVRQTLTGQIADGPIVVAAFSWNLSWFPLRVALNADIVCPHIIELRRVDDRRLVRVLHVRAARSVALFAADIPFRRRLRLDVVVD